MSEKLNGVLLHISSLPSEYGIGALGDSAFSFVDFLSDCGVNYWQMLPVGVTSYGDSPYQSPSAFAGNPYFIDLDTLAKEGLLTLEELETAKTECLDYEKLFDARYGLLRAAYARFKSDKAYNSFIAENNEWLQDFALFMAVKSKFGFASFDAWPVKYRHKDKISAEAIAALSADIGFWCFLQYEFDKQMCKLKAYANSKGVGLIGDIPIYVAYDSADVWANKQLFKLDESLKPTEVAGVPPDYFAARGQLWGNPLYNWPKHREENFAWWHARLLHQLKYFDKIRIDHFRGFESYYKVRYGAPDAMDGKWAKGVGTAVFDGISEELRGKIIAEDLGMIDNKVRRLVKASGFPGMKVFQFAFDGKPKNEHLPKNLKENTVYYTGTHDNDTIKSWYDNLPLGTKNLVRECVKETDGSKIQAAILKKVMKSKAFLTVVPMQDYLWQGAEARMNTPGVIGDNWRYKLPVDYIKAKIQIKTVVKYR